MIQGFAVLLSLQLVGEVVSRALGLPVPGPVLGMALLVVVLALWSKTDRPDPLEHGRPLERAADGLLASLSILFVPAGVGVVQYLDLIEAEGLPIAASIVVSTALAMLATVATFRLVKRLQGRAEEETEA